MHMMFYVSCRNDACRAERWQNTHARLSVGFQETPTARKVERLHSTPSGSIFFARARVLDRFTDKGMYSVCNSTCKSYYTLHERRRREQENLSVSWSYLFQFPSFRPPGHPLHKRLQPWTERQGKTPISQDDRPFSKGGGMESPDVPPPSNVY